MFDVGANTGFYSLIAASANPTLQVHAFEPFPEVREMLVDNIRINRLADSITVSPQAVSDSEGEADLYIPGREHGLVETSASLSGEFKGSSHRIIVPVTSLDVYATRAGDARVGFIKIDVESLEHLVLNGARRILAEDRPLVVLEVLPDHADLPSIRQSVARLDYVDIRLREDVAILAAAVEYDALSWNHLLVPRELLPTWVQVIGSIVPVAPN